MRTLLTVPAALALCWLTATGQTPKKPDDTKPPAKKVEAPLEFDITMADGSHVRALMLDPSVVVLTKFGALTIPFAELRRVEFGFRFPEGVEAKVEEAVAKLGSSAFAEREAAERSLMEFKEYAVPAVRRASKSTDPEVSRRADAVLKRLTDRLPDEKMNMKDQDTVTTSEFTIRGRVQPTEVRVRTKYFGEVALKLAETRAMAAGFSSGGQADLSLDAAKYARQGWTGWLDTDIDVSNDLPLEVTVTGQIDQWSQEPGRYLSSPRGTGAMAPGTPGLALAPGMPGMPGGPGGFQPGMQPGRFISGAVYGRIGAKGELFFIGDGFKAKTAPGTGRLYLIIGPSSWNNETTGTYKVKVKVGE
jgi:hypothetical protein